MAETGRQAAGKSSARRTGRRVALVLYYFLVVWVSLIGAVEITYQVFFGPAPAGPYKHCREGLVALHTAISRAREATAGTDGEDAALAHYRAALDPEWSYRDGIAALCRGSEPQERALDAIEHLRYAEEHAVRREAGELAPLRRRVQAIVDELSPEQNP